MEILCSLCRKEKTFRAIFLGLVTNQFDAFFNPQNAPDRCERHQCHAANLENVRVLPPPMIFMLNFGDNAHRSHSGQGIKFVVRRLLQHAPVCGACCAPQARKLLTGTAVGEKNAIYARLYARKPSGNKIVRLNLPKLERRVSECLGMSWRRNELLF